MNKHQKKIKEFCRERNWGQFHNPKDLLLGIVEEVGELRNTIKWEQDNEKLKAVIKENKEEFADNLADIFWFMSILANENDIDLDKAFDLVIKSNEKRFPTKEVKNHHTNVKMGGPDRKYKK